MSECPNRELDGGYAPYVRSFRVSGRDPESGHSLRQHHNVSIWVDYGSTALELDMAFSAVYPPRRHDRFSPTGVADEVLDRLCGRGTTRR